MVLTYLNIQESFGMGGPYLGYLNFQGTIFNSKFIADSEKLSKDKTRIALCQYSGEFKKSLFHSKKRMFHLIVYVYQEDAFYKSLNSYTGLFIENFTEDKIIFYEAFHNSYKKFYRELTFNKSNFTKISKLNL